MVFMYVRNSLFFVPLFVYTRANQMNTLNICYLVIYWTQKVHNYLMRSIQMFQRFASAWIPLEKNYFGWERSHSCTACCTSSSDLRLAFHRLFGRSEDMKVSGVEVWRVRRMWKTLEGQILDCCNSWTASMGPSIVILRRPRRFNLIARPQLIL